ncbi:MAG TPA: serine/threonine protein kinase [bacterium]|nr:serine/threonine protein kinase [bacterium]
MVSKDSVEIEEKYIGRTINNRYRIIENIGVGGMGNVYLAEHEILKKKVAVKILHFEQSKRKDTLERFKREAIAASNMGQANIVDVTDFGYTEEGNAYFVMEYIDGRSLADIIRDRKILPLEFAVSVACQVCVALYSAHGKGIIHRDLKPENILVTEKDGIYPFVKIVDFGISKILSDETTKKRPRTLTKTGAIFGTPEYMSPEQAGGEAVEPASDIYSLGIILYEMITGKILFTDDNYMKVLHKHQYEFPEIPSAVNSDVSPDVDAMIMKCLEKKPFNRYESMLYLLGDLKKIYIKHNLESKLSLSFIFNSGTVSQMTENVSEEKGLSGEDIMKILNSENMEGSAYNDFSDEEPGSTGIFLKLMVFVLLLVLAGFLLFAYMKKGKPIVIEREQDTKKESVEEEEKPALEEKKPLRVKQRTKPATVTKPVQKKPGTIKLTVNSNLNGVRVYNKENGETLCHTPCARSLPRRDGDVMILGFEMEDFSIRPMAISLDRDMIVNVNLKEAGGDS